LLRLRVPIRDAEKKPKKRFTVSKEFSMRSKVTDRTLAVGEAFGIGIDEEQRFPVFQDFQVEVKPGDIVYVTGESGGGKSVLLRELKAAMEASGEFGVITTDWDLRIDLDEVLVHGVGRMVNEALETLSLAGLNDAFLWLRSYRQLSDGQKYRYKVAKMTDSGAFTWLFDEFAATLDREMARIVAFSVQKTARRLGRTVVAATTHTDLAEDLAPSVRVHKGFMSAATVEYHPGAAARECTVARETFIRPGSKQDYEALKQFHYRHSGALMSRRVYALCLREPENVVGVIVYAPSPYLAAGRTKFLGRVATHEEVNRDWVIISRVVLHPRLRSIGLGVKLVRETLPRVCEDLGVRYVEAIAVMARYNPFFAKARMTEVDCQSGFREGCRQVLAKLQAYGFELMLTVSRTYNLKVYAGLTPQQQEEVRSLIFAKRGLLLTERYVHKTPPKEQVAEDLKDPALVAAGIRRAAIGAQEKKYYVWQYPRE